MALNSLLCVHCADVLLRNCSLSHSLTHSLYVKLVFITIYNFNYNLSFAMSHVTTTMAENIYATKSPLGHWLQWDAPRLPQTCPHQAVHFAIPHIGMLKYPPKFVPFCPCISSASAPYPKFVWKFALYWHLFSEISGIADSLAFSTSSGSKSTLVTIFSCPSIPVSMVKLSSHSIFLSPFSKNFADSFSNTSLPCSKENLRHKVSRQRVKQ